MLARRQIASLSLTQRPFVCYIQIVQRYPVLSGPAGLSYSQFCENTGSRPRYTARAESAAYGLRILHQRNILVNVKSLSIPL